MNDRIESFDVKGFTVNIFYDDGLPNPREDDNLGLMYCAHTKYHLGDTQIDLPNFASDGELLPLYLYDHGGITMSTSPFSCPWDSGQVGWIYASPDAIRKNFNAKRISKHMREKVKQILKDEVKEYDRYLRGEAYGYTVQSPDGEEVDACWGFNDIEYCKSIAKEFCIAEKINIT
jgi:hypothetical protein